MPTQPTAGRTLVTRRAVFDIVRTATLGSYGVTGFACSPLDRLLGWLGFGHPGIAVHLGETLDIELDLTVAYGVPIAEVARQVDSAIRYALRKALDREVRRLTIHIDGLRFGTGAADRRRCSASTQPRSDNVTSPTAGRTSPDGTPLV